MPFNFRTLDLNLLRVFDAVMAEGSLTRAAAGLSMTQPAVSHALRRLREAVGAELFVRVAHGVTPTPRAEALWPQVRSALGTLRQALAPGDFDPRRDAVQFRIAMVDATAAMLAPGLVQDIDRGGAQVNVRVLPLATRDPRALLDAGDAELAVGYFPEAVTAIVAQGPDSHLRQTRLYETRYVCAMRRGHALAGSMPTLDTFCAAHHLLVSFSGRPHARFDHRLPRRRGDPFAQPAVRRLGIVTQVPDHVHRQRRQRQRQFAGDEFVVEARGGDESFGQRRQQLGSCDDPRGGEELVDGEHDAPLPPHPRQGLVDEAVRPAAPR